VIQGCAHPSPFSAALSHISKEFEEVLLAPHGSAHFTTDRPWRSMQTQDVLGQTPKCGEVLGAIVLALPSVIFIEYDVERPMQMVLDAPVRAHGIEQFDRCERPRQ